jgi:hypothetical protein
MKRRPAMPRYQYMTTRRPLCVLVASALLCGAADEPWKTKQVPDWTVDDAKLVLSDSPWACTVSTTVAKPGNRKRGQGPGGISIGIPGIGGMGGPRGGYPAGGRGGPVGRPPAQPDENPADDAPSVRLRWESALPIRQAELKAREANAPDVDQNSYVIAVYAVPTRYLSGDPKGLAAQLKKEAAIRRDGQKDLKPTSVEIMERDDGPVVLYLFPRKAEIKRGDRRLEFVAQIGRLQFSKAFYVEDMTYQGKLEL